MASQPGQVGRILCCQTIESFRSVEVLPEIVGRLLDNAMGTAAAAGIHEDIEATTGLWASLAPVDPQEAEAERRSRKRPRHGDRRS